MKYKTMKNNKTAFIDSFVEKYKDQFKGTTFLGRRGYNQIWEKTQKTTA